MSLYAILLLLLLAPVIALIPGAFSFHTESMVHVWMTLIPKACINTLALMLVVSVSTIIFGVGFAFFVTYFDFPGRRLLSAFLPVGLALPGYVLAFLFVEMFDYTGPLQSGVRGLIPSFGFNFRGFFSLVMVLTFALTPYVFLMSRLGFEKQGARLKQVCTSLGAGWLRSSLRVLLPANAPWILSGLLIVNMEILSDFGTVSAFHYETFTYAIYRAWFGLFQFGVASQISLFLTLIVILLLLLKSGVKTSKRYTDVSTSDEPVSKEKLPLLPGLALGFVSYTFLVVGYILPLIRLLILSVSAWRDMPSMLNIAISSLVIGLLAVVLALPVGYALSISATKSSLSRWLSAIGNYGYAIPGTVLAVGCLLLMQQVKGSLGLESVIAPIIFMAYGHSVKFLNVASQPIQTGLKKIKAEYKWISDSLGVGRYRYFFKVRAPLLKTSFIGASMFVFVEVTKEMPLTLMMRPYGWDTFAVKVYEFTSEGEWERAAIPALCIVGMTLLPTFIFGRSLKGGGSSL